MDNQEMMVQGGYGQIQSPQPMNASAMTAMSTTREAQEVQAAVFMAKRWQRLEINWMPSIISRKQSTWTRT